MTYIDEILKRLDIQHLRAFLLHGVECAEPDSKTYEQRIADAWKPVKETIKRKYPGIVEYDQITDEINHLEKAIMDVHMEIGIRCGAILAAQLLSAGTASWRGEF